MAVFKNFKDNELIISCKCGCDEGIHFANYCFMSFTNGNFYAEQKYPFWKKLKKIWAIVRNKDFYYSEIIMSKNDDKPDITKLKERWRLLRSRLIIVMKVNGCSILM